VADGKEAVNVREENVMASESDATLTQNVLAVILGGGQGTRLFPLTKDRAKPAVSLAGKYRLVDIPISNCIHSGFLRMHLLTQFNSASLHRHISQAYKFDPFSGGFVGISAAEQTLTDRSWYEGTADAVRKNLVHFASQSFDYLLVLSGDQLYRMDYRTLVAQHIRNKADVTVATIPVTRKDVPGFGIMRIAPGCRITDFVEKPKDPSVQDQFRIDEKTYLSMGMKEEGELFLASMGIYVFSRDALFSLMANEYHDFGKELIPAAIRDCRVFAYVFCGAWRDIGTIRAFFDANLDLTAPEPQFDFFDPRTPIFTRARFLPASKISGASISESLISEGCVIDRARINRSVIGLRGIVRSGAEIKDTVMMGCDYYQSEAAVRADQSENRPMVGIGRNTRIDTAIIDKNARIGDNCVISPAGKAQDVDHPLYYVRDGIVVIPKNGLIPHETVI
jgi:glucose-1-phosphate adenylyltransferase